MLMVSKLSLLFQGIVMPPRKIASFVVLCNSLLWPGYYGHYDIGIACLVE